MTEDSFVTESEHKIAILYSILCSDRVKEACQMKRAITLLMVSYGASSALTDALVMYGLTVGSSARLESMDVLGEGYICSKVGEHLQKNGKIATVCKLGNYALTIQTFQLLICKKSIKIIYILILADNINITVQRQVEALRRESKTQYNWIYWWIRGIPDTSSLKSLYIPNHPGNGM